MLGRRIVTALLTALLICIKSASSHAVDEAIAATGRPLHIALFVDVTPFLCYSDGHIEATRRLTDLAVKRINKYGGVRGRPIELTIYDNKANRGEALINVTAALNKPDLLALIGLSDADSAKSVFDFVNKRTGGQVPFISSIPPGDTLASYDNVFSTLPDQEIERVAVMTEFFKTTGRKKIAFLGRSEAAHVEEIRIGLESRIASTGAGMQFMSTPLIQVHGKGDDIRLDAGQLDTAIAEIERDPPDMLVVAVDTIVTAQVLRRLAKSTVKPEIFTTGWLTPKLLDQEEPYPRAIYGIDWASVPEVESDRLFNILGRGEPEDWLFAGLRTVSTADWRKNKCQEFYPNYVPSTYSPHNIAAAREGAKFADIIKLVAASAAKTGHSLDLEQAPIFGRTPGRTTTPIQEYRKAILKDLRRTYAAGNGSFKGIFENWSFHSDYRVRAQMPSIVLLPYKLGRKQLAQVQFVRLRDYALKQIETVYMDIDLVRMYSVDNNKKSFFAEFFLAMRKSDKISIKDINFTNAFLDPRASRDEITNGREISIEALNDGRLSAAYPPDMLIYKIAGRFRFTPDFAEYPFDRQQFSIDLQARSGDNTFIIQPPPLELRDKVVASEGWVPDKQYVSYLEDFVPIVDAFTHTPSVVPFYNTRFVWQMERETTDYYIRVVVPLLFILVVAYLSIFIPKTNLEAIVTIQVTALLAAVALYLSLPQIDSDVATISDWIFVFDYMMVSMMIVVSILRINARVIKFPWVNGVLAFTHIVIIPAVLLVVVLWISKAELLDSFVRSPVWKILNIA